ncbi:MAG: exodeoxyribonuclease VII large subunit [Pseudomonadota bacterium]
MKYTEPSQSDSRTILSVTDINLQLKQSIAASFSLLWIEGEISNLARPASGHIYFSLKDQNAQIRCVMFRINNQRVPFEISNGTQVIVRAKASLYEPRGDLQLIIDNMEEAGYGALQRQFEILKTKLFAEGLFDKEHKRILPSYPKEIAIVTSASSAAIKDFLKISQRRYPICKKSIYNVPVQGTEAPAAITSAIQAINRHTNANIIVLIRGGGSIEDLWAFNDESIARAISNSKIPIVTGIGHEIDYTIADFVADLRAPTPSAAAELTCPDLSAVTHQLSGIQSYLSKFLKDKLETNSQKLDWLSQRIQRMHPKSIVQIQNTTVTRLYERLKKLVHLRLNQDSISLNSFKHRLRNQSPQQQLELNRSKLELIGSQLINLSSEQISNHKHRLQLCAATMQAVSPLNTLERGYSITMNAKHKARIIRNHNHIKQGDHLITYVANGEIHSRVESTNSQILINPSSKSEEGSD